MKKVVLGIFFLLQVCLMGASIDMTKLYDDFQLQGKMQYSIFEKAYYGYLKVPGKKTDFLGIIDYTKPSWEKRFFLLDLRRKKLAKYTYVSHAKNSGLDWALHFSDRKNSKQSSLGFYLTKGTYSGKYGYTLILKGLEEGFNANAESRKIVLHGATTAEEKYLKTYGFLGRSWGCPSVPSSEARAIIDSLKCGQVLFIIGKDENYEKTSKYMIQKKQAKD